jgi:hypothetical protein
MLQWASVALWMGSPGRRLSFKMRVGRRSSMLSRGPGEGGGYGRLYILEAVSALSWCCDDWRTFGLPARYRLAKCGA